MWCPRCEQGEVVKATIKKTQNTIYVCDECEATWFNKSEIDSKSFVDFGSYMKSIDLEPLWSEIAVSES
ncbi:hypothetical protein [Vibrio sp. SCSIO 43137]|uniref:hypothetical protein n=1 Tax=Vibrio sp. SCSIO 43137 TaxID=3021011 RepID=UPI0023078651|nr:hypothetical protein [Vibrio sp. SCSIO 43137]WCE32068.1 hypothetical protein PK654_16305 [Vibrio sp. SCSIO 43137]